MDEIMEALKKYEVIATKTREEIWKEIKFGIANYGYYTVKH
jgi:hypothetical protein